MQLRRTYVLALTTGLFAVQLGCAERQLGADGGEVPDAAPLDAERAVDSATADAAPAPDGPRLPPPPSSGSPHDYFNALVARRDHWRAISFRPVPGDTDNQSPYWERQLNERNAGGFQTNGNGLEFNTSTESLRNRADRDLVAYVRNLAVLRSRTLDPPADGLLVRPVR